jgi:hypothetical protein
VHRHCILNRISAPPAGKCPICGGDPDSDIAREVWRERAAH